MEGGLNKRILVGIYQYLVKLWVFFTIPWTKVLWDSITEWRPRELPKEIEEVRNLLTLEGLWKTIHGDEYDVWEVKVSNLLKLQDVWHFIVEEYPRDLDSFKYLPKFQKERRKVVSLCLIQDNIDYSLFHYIIEANTPKRAWNIY